MVASVRVMNHAVADTAVAAGRSGASHPRPAMLLLRLIDADMGIGDV
jgi:hypothetical protein